MTSTEPDFVAVAQLLVDLSPSYIAPVFPPALLEMPVWLDLSKDNAEMARLDIVKTEVLDRFVTEQISRASATVGVGGYLEHRDRYQTSGLFAAGGEEPRSIHLGIDLWAPAGTEVFAPLAGAVHSFQDNANYFDYGPTLILKHEINGLTFHTLYGHLSRESLTGLSDGKRIEKGQPLARLGTASVNGDWPPHLHFQIIVGMQGKRGDYPGVAAPSKLSYYKNNCPDPNLILRIT